jgi:hypothetical protein
MNKQRPPTIPMNEWGFISYESLVALGKAATNCKFINRCGYEQMARLALSNPHSS